MNGRGGRSQRERAIPPGKRRGRRGRGFWVVGRRLGAAPFRPRAPPPRRGHATPPAPFLAAPLARPLARRRGGSAGSMAEVSPCAPGLPSPATGRFRGWVVGGSWARCTVRYRRGAGADPSPGLSLPFTPPLPFVVSPQQRQDKAVLISETRRRFEAEYLAGERRGGGLRGCGLGGFSRVGFCCGRFPG